MRKRNGFSMIELTVTLMIGAALTDIAVRNIGPAQNAAAVNSSAHTMTSLVAHARAHAIERGAIARLLIDAAQDRAQVVVGDDVLETVRFRQMGVDVQAGSPNIRLCMNASGFGETGCNSFTDDVHVKLVAGSRSKDIVLGPLGRAIEL